MGGGKIQINSVKDYDEITVRVAKMTPQSPKAIFITVRNGEMTFPFSPGKIITSMRRSAEMAKITHRRVLRFLAFIMYDVL